MVEIERTVRKKPYLGGYRHKKTGVEYHHAGAQTVQKQKPLSTAQKFCRDTQTVKQKHNIQQTSNDMATQMTKVGMFVANLTDKLMLPGKYTTADDHNSMLLQQVSGWRATTGGWVVNVHISMGRECPHHIDSAFIH